VLFEHRENVLPVHAGVGRPLFGRVLRGAGFAVAAGRQAGGLRPCGGGDEIGQQPALKPRAGRLGAVPIGARGGQPGRGGGPARRNAFLEHPAGKKGQRRFLHHLFEQDGQLPPKIGNVFQFGHFEISQRGIRTVAKIVHWWFPKPAHGLSPGAEASIPTSARQRRVTELRFSTSLITAVDNRAGGGLPVRPHSIPPTGGLGNGYVQRLLG